MDDHPHRLDLDNLRDIPSNMGTPRGSWTAHCSAETPDSLHVQTSTHPPVVSHAMLAIQQLASVKAVPFGGYSQAERQRIIMGQPELVEALELDPSQVSCEQLQCCAQLLCLHLETSCFAEESHELGSFIVEVLIHVLLLDTICHIESRQISNIRNDMQDNCVAALGVKGNFMFESATHRSVFAVFTLAALYYPCSSASDASAPLDALVLRMAP